MITIELKIIDNEDDVSISLKSISNKKETEAEREIHDDLIKILTEYGIKKRL